MKHTLIRLLLAWSLIATCLLFMQREAQKPLLVYHADSKYQMTGKVEEKTKNRKAIHNHGKRERVCGE